AASALPWAYARLHACPCDSSCVTCSCAIGSMNVSSSWRCSSSAIVSCSNRVASCAGEESPTLVAQLCIRRYTFSTDEEGRMGRRIAVAGASGYAGGELLRLIQAHPELDLAAVSAATSAGQPVTSVHPHLPSLATETFVPTDADVLADSDLVFLALPHGESAALAAQLPAEHPIVDLGADFRLNDPATW